MKSERERQLEEAVIIAHAALKSIAENPACEFNHIRAGTAKQCIKELHDEIIENNILIGG